MFVVPAVNPVTTPDAEPIVATLVLLLVHRPPIVPLLNVVVDPSHTVVLPEIATGVWFTVILIVAAHPDASV